MSVFENATFTVLIDGISRACANQLVRHRLASYCQESQRYVKALRRWTVPSSFNEAQRAIYYRAQENATDAYQDLLALGANPEDARYVLGVGAQTTITMTINVRELFHFLNLRTSKSAQWEIRELADVLCLALATVDDQWYGLIELWKTGGSE